MSTDPTTKTEADAALVAAVKAYANAIAAADNPPWRSLLLPGDHWMHAVGEWFLVSSRDGRLRYVDSESGQMVEERAVIGYAPDVAPRDLQPMRQARKTALTFRRCLGSGGFVNESIVESRNLTEGMRWNCTECRSEVPLEAEGEQLRFPEHDKAGRT